MPRKDESIMKPNAAMRAVADTARAPQQRPMPCHLRFDARLPVRAVLLGLPSLRVLRGALALLVSLLVTLASLALDAGSAHAQGRPYNLPLVGRTLGTPMLMINMSKDHQLSYRAYVEYTDLDGDGELERTYKHAINYYGYFDAWQCYSYSGGVFTPGGYSATKYCSGAWSGNFLNWATMTRMDIIRKILFGGYRSTDTASTTILERAYLPTDAHAFAKYYNGADIASLTPFNVAEITMCNTTIGTGASHNNTRPPLMRVARGNYQLWNNNEGIQCYWAEERGASWTSDPNQKFTTGLNAEISNPSRNAVALNNGGSTGGDFIVRVASCVGSVMTPVGQNSFENCYRYPDGNRKPVGLLHEYGQENRMLFGLMTGSFERNTSGGVLRSNMGSFRDEVNVETDGTFKLDFRGIVWNINKLRIYGYDHDGTTYMPYDNNCTYQLIGLTDGRCRSWGNPMSEIYMESLRYLAGKPPTSAFQVSSGADSTLGLTAPTWQDPFKPQSGGQMLPGVNACSPLHVLNFNASVSSWDYAQQVDITGLGASGSASAFTDVVGAGEGLNGTRRPIGVSGGTDGLCTPKSITGLGSINGLCPEAPTQQGSFMIAGAAYWARTNRIRTDLSGVPADTPEFKPLRVNTLGVAMATNTPIIRIPVPGASGKMITLQPTYLLVLGASRGNGTLVDFRLVYQDLARGQGRFYINWEDSEQGGDYDQDVSGYIKYWFSNDRTKLYIESLVTGYSSGNPQGFGYIITGVAQGGPRFHSGAANFSYTHGVGTNVYRPNGTSPDGRVSILGAQLNGVAGSRINASGGCTNCVSSAGWDGGGGLATIAEYDVTGTPIETLKDPLWYAAKWGGFRDLDGDNRPSSMNEWAARNRNTPPYASMSDDEAAQVVPPDNFFFAANPGQLPAALRQALQTAEGDNSRSGMAVTSRLLTVGDTGTATRAYATTFRTNWTGDVKAFTFAANGSAAVSVRAGDAFEAVDASGGRAIITRGSGGPVPLRWASLNAADRSLLNVNPDTLQADTLGERRVGWLRGNGADEIQRAGPFRDRASKLGDMVNSTPVYVGQARAMQRIGAEDASYTAFRNSTASRRQMLYVGANDGMLHAFDATTLREVFAYVPGMLLKKLPKLTSPNYTHEFFVDGSPFVADVKVSGSWSTLLFSSLGAGGQGLFALDVTNPSLFTEGNASRVARWEFSDRNDSDLGYVLGDTSPRLDFLPNQVATLPNGETYVVFGNGVASGTSDDYVGNGRSVLFLLRAAGPTGADWVLGVDYFKITVGSTGENGGLGMPYLVDTDEDGKMDTAYAGDLLGRLWKFDLSSANPNQWRSAFGTAPLITVRSSANTVQPITAAPIAAKLSRTLGGVFVAFGTGKLYELADVSDTNPQTIYGVWDNASTVPSGRGSLTRQTMTSTGGTTRALSSNPVCLKATQQGCASATLTRGWYVDLGSTERVIYPPAFDGAADLMVTSTIPGNTASCESDGYTWFNRMRLLSGTARSDVVFDTNSDGKVTDSDVRASALRMTGVRKSVWLMQPRTECTGPACSQQPCYAAQSSAPGVVGSTATACPAVDTGRLNWREVIR